MTTGGPESMYKIKEEGGVGDTVEGFLKHFNNNTPKLCSFEVLPIFVAHGVNFMNEE